MPHPSELSHAFYQVAWVVTIGISEGPVRAYPCDATNGTVLTFDGYGTFGEWDDDLATGTVEW